MTDKFRWADLKNHESLWDSRTNVIAKMIADGSRVLEFGAGRMLLRMLLPAGCSYTPADIVSRGPGTIICDLNRKPLPALGRYDVIVFSGVLEYVFDISGLFSHLRPSCDTIIASYSVTEQWTSSAIAVRRKNGWVNDYSLDEFMKVGTSTGYTCVDHQVFAHAQEIFTFKSLGVRAVPIF